MYTQSTIQIFTAFVDGAVCYIHRSNRKQLLIVGQYYVLYYLVLVLLVGLLKGDKSIFYS